jgi:hypothetical protein
MSYVTSNEYEQRRAARTAVQERHARTPTDSLSSLCTYQLFRNHLGSSVQEFHQLRKRLLELIAASFAADPPSFPTDVEITLALVHDTENYDSYDGDRLPFPRAETCIDHRETRTFHVNWQTTINHWFGHTYDDADIAKMVRTRFLSVQTTITSHSHRSVDYLIDNCFDSQLWLEERKESTRFPGRFTKTSYCLSLDIREFEIPQSESHAAVVLGPIRTKGLRYALVVESEVLLQPSVGDANWPYGVPVGGDVNL